mmetsp:Transcript_11111/g.21146  ORF Transcript_11111/g.21146 Transcript_11111/m.21146 type:complete len:859 (-) Transcript_11111:216-2792(-)
MAHLYGGFQEEDQIEQHENDEDIGALGSILSWDDEDQNDTGDDGSAGSGDDSRASDGEAAPPDMVQFSMKDGVPQFNFLTGTNGGAPNMQQQPQQMQQQQQNGNNAGNLTMQLPMPRPIATMQNTGTASNQPQQQPQQQAVMNNTAPTEQQQQQQQNMNPVAPQDAAQQALAATFAQFLAQQFQQQQRQAQQQQQQPHQQQAMQQQQPSQQQQAMQQLRSQQQQNNTNQGQSLNSMLQSNHRQPAAPIPQQQQQPQQQNQSGMQLPFTADPNTFLQQLQFAQLQQQLQFAQQQQNQQQQQQVQQPQQQVQRKRPASSAPTNGTPQFVAQGRPPLPVATASSRATGQPATKKPKSSKTPKTTATKGPSKSKSKTAGVTTKMGIVSASDTDGEGSKRSKKKAAAAAAAAESAAMSANASMSDGDDYPSNDDKAQANRDRNREHARNTRLRKKAYLEKLKITVDELCKERDTLVSERAGAANLLVEMHNTRTEVLMSFFALRSTNEKRRALWSSILDESCFACVMPVTPYRSFPASEVQVSKCQRTILGIDAMMADNASLHVLFSSLVDRAKYPDGKIEFRYTLVTEESVVAGNQMMARWVMTTTNATELGARMEVTKQGMLCCKYNSSHRIIGLELMFDVMAFMLQLKQSAGSDNFPVIPNTVQTCQRRFDKPMVLTLAEPPYTIVQVNKLWEDMTGYSAEEVVGKASCKILQGRTMDRANLDELMQEVRFKRPCATMLSNIKKSGQDFRHFVIVFPLSTDSRITHYLALSSRIPDGVGRSSSQSMASNQMQRTAATSFDSKPSAIEGFQSAKSSSQQAQNNTPLHGMLVGSSQNPITMHSKPAPTPNFSWSMAPPPCRK